MEHPERQAVLIVLTAAVGAGAPASAQTTCTSYAGNPILRPRPAAGWDSTVAFTPQVVHVDGVYYLFYSGEGTDPTACDVAIGLATSTDPVTGWSRACGGLPILTGDGTGFDACFVAVGPSIVEEDTWILYYNGHADPNGRGPGRSVGRATAPGPCGPWERLPDPVLEGGSPGEWDAGVVNPDSLVVTGEGEYVMYYTGRANHWGVGGPLRVGMATSTDGINWTKHDDPTTTAPPFAESDPIFDLGDPGEWDDSFVFYAAVRKTDCRWDMYYAGSNASNEMLSSSIGYASSRDGRRWTRYAGNPVMVHGTQSWAPDLVWPASTLVVGSTYHLYYAGGQTSLWGASSGVATAPMEPDRNGNGIPDGCECPADVNGDGTVDTLDLLAVLTSWGQSGVPEDINGDGVVDVLDLLELLLAWGPCV